MDKMNKNVIFDSEPEVEIEELEIAEVLNEYVRWMCNPDNLYNCEDCPENHGFSRWPETRKPCGQFRCWVAIHCKDLGKLKFNWENSK